MKNRIEMRNDSNKQLIMLPSCCVHAVADVFTDSITEWSHFRAVCGLPYFFLLPQHWYIVTVASAERWGEMENSLNWKNRPPTAHRFIYIFFYTVLTWHWFYYHHHSINYWIEMIWTVTKFFYLPPLASSSCKKWFSKHVRKEYKYIFIRWWYY